MAEKNSASVHITMDLIEVQRAIIKSEPQSSETGIYKRSVVRTPGGWKMAIFHSDARKDGAGTEKTSNETSGPLGNLVA